MKQVVKIKCPVCQTPASQEVETRVNSILQPNLKKDLLNGQLQFFECSDCGARRQIETDFLYHDPKNKFMVFLIPNLRKKQDQLSTLLENVARDEKVNLSDYELRIVTHHPDLVEKIQLFDNGYNDREVEIVKLLTDGLFAKERPNEEVKSRFFYMKNKEPKIMYITANEQLLVDFSDNLHTFAKDKYKKVVSTSEKGQFHLINAEWAAHALSGN
ncbi:CpXC domain-containing protein [Aerococcaceae bacterium DSM 111021]|nr:CpXC domain-containing protein [Aerococcaceae bacterium DSM 111021]